MHLKFFLVLFSMVTPIWGNEMDFLSESKIVGGTLTKIETAPFMAFFKLNDENYCGGSIINKNQILTAAHCMLHELKNPKIKVGSTFYGTFTQTFDVTKVVSHPKFNNVTFDYDVAVVTIKGSLKFSKSITPIALAGKDFKIPEGALVRVTGWGATETESISDQLQEITVPIVSHKTCAESYKKVNFTVTNNMLCAGNGGKDSCQGDSGGPMTYQGKVAGIVSFGEKCGSPDFPGVYTSVSAVRPWLDTVIACN